MKTFIIRLSDDALSCTLALDAKNAAEQCKVHAEYFDGVKRLQAVNFLADRRITINSNFFSEPLGTWGCLASHLSLWELCVEKQAPLTILEHDGIMLRNPDEVTDLVDEYCHLDGYLPLDSSLPVHCQSHFKIYNEQVKIFTPGIHSEIKFRSIVSAAYDITGVFYAGAYGYIVTPKGADKLISFVKKVGAIPADLAMCEKAVSLQRTCSTYVRLHPFYRSKIIQKKFSTRR